MNRIDIEECGSEESRRVLRELGLRDDESSPGLLGRLEGYAEVLCRNEDGSVAWESKQKNIVTDAALRRFAFGWHTSRLHNMFNCMLIFLSPSTEAPVANRYSLADDGSGITYNNGGSAGAPGVMNPSYNGATLTWTYSYTFSGANRVIGTIGLGSSYNAAWNLWGIAVWAYTLIAPPKTQTTNQTVETVYRITLVPSY